MSGKNKYTEIFASAQRSYNYDPALNELIRKARKPPITKPCVFLSHISEDKQSAHKIADYFADAGLDYYLDIDDPELQRAVRAGDDEEITKFIELGIKNSSHLLTIVSAQTRNSWWVPFEIGYGKRGEIDLASLALSDVPSPPSYLKITRQVSGISGLNGYIDDIKKSATKALLHSVYNSNAVFPGRVTPAHSPIHPLLNHLKMY